MRTNSRRAAACMAALLMTVTACGAATPEQDGVGVASLAGEERTGESGGAEETRADGVGSGSPASDREAPEDPDLAFALYDKCMADAGFDFETRFEGEDGEGVQVQELEVADEGDPQQGDAADLDFGEEFEAADRECGQHLAGLDQSFDLTPEQEAAFEDAQLAWAACMREQGVDLADVDAGGTSAGVVIVGPEGDGDDPQAGGIDDLDFEAFDEAAEQCNGVFDEVAPEVGLDSEEAGS